MHSPALAPSGTRGTSLAGRSRAAAAVAARLVAGTGSDTGGLRIPAVGAAWWALPTYGR
jgi:hypothetical protein